MWKKFTSIYTSAHDKESVAEAQEKGAEVNMPQRMEGWELWQKDHNNRHHRDEVIQFQRSIRNEIWVHYLKSQHNKPSLEQTKKFETVIKLPTC